MDILEENLESNKSLIIDNEVKGYLSETAKWAKFLAVLGYIGLVFMGIGVLSMLFLANRFQSMPGGNVSTMPFGIMAIVYIVMIVLYFFPVYYLGKFASNMKNGIYLNNQLSVNEGFEYLKSHYKFLGIFAIVIMSMYVLMMIFAIGAAAM
ncbi:MAG: DUF5362 family protein [Fluviicola sp.]|jgi:hypothetical protein|nr:DUF5362 family protein [Fluviicola sp.]